MVYTRKYLFHMVEYEKKPEGLGLAWNIFKDLLEDIREGVIYVAGWRPKKKRSKPRSGRIYDVEQGGLTMLV